MVMKSIVHDICIRRSNSQIFLSQAQSFQQTFWALSFNLQLNEKILLPYRRIWYGPTFLHKQLKNWIKYEKDRAELWCLREEKQKDEPWDAKVGSQETPGVTGKFGLGVQNEAGQRLIEFCQENTLVIANTHFQQHKRRLYTWTSPDGQHWNQIDYILCSQRWRSSIQSAKTRPGADCGSDYELLIAKFRLKLKRVGITTRPFRYDLNQIQWMNRQW